MRTQRKPNKTLEQCDSRCGVAPTDPDYGIMHAKEDGYEGMATPNYNVQTAAQNQYVTNYDTYDSAGESPLLWALSTPVWKKTESSRQLLSKMPDTDVRKYMSGWSKDRLRQ